ncbi:MAG TPA: septal ring lytic transglycosylase RlpA family protein [Aestuariivirgaceae bacterium]|nr:septal ring lytic transglycosylase RlpA family protein [Aestuariivirgaceae bacterium]
MRKSFFATVVLGLLFLGDAVEMVQAAPGRPLPMGFAELCGTAPATCDLAGFELHRAVLRPDSSTDALRAVVAHARATPQPGLTVPDRPWLDFDDCSDLIVSPDCYLETLPLPRGWLFDLASLESRDIGSRLYGRLGMLPRGGGRQHLGKTYTIAGLTFRPALDRRYDAVGRASWYGHRYHSRMTSNGEWFDMEYLSAAHATMPLPSYARVINLDNGREIVVRVNDRGPFVADRLIDVSKRAAELLGFRDRGLAKVRVQYLGPAPLNDNGTELAAMNRELVRSAAIERGDDKVALGRAPVIVLAAAPVMNF